MAFNPIPIVAVAVGITLLLRKGGGASQDEPMPEPEPEPLPEPEPEPAPEPETPTKSAVARAAKYKRIPKGYQLPDGITHSDIWVSSDCQAAVMGRDYEPFTNVADGEDPALFWSTYAQGARPDYGPEEAVEKSAAMAFTEMALKTPQSYGTAPCGDQVPDIDEINTYQEYSQAWTDLRNRKLGLAELYDEIYDRTRSAMMREWANSDPDSAYAFQVGEYAQWAKSNFPNASLEDQTDEAYGRWKDKFDDADMPDVLDPNNPDHATYIQLWIDLRDSIASL